MLLQWTVNTAAKIIGAPLPSILDIFLTRCSNKTDSVVKDPTHPSQSLPAPTIRKTVLEHQSLLCQTAQQLFSPGCESPELKSKSISRIVVYRFILFTSLLYACIYVAPWSCEARHFVPLYVPTCSGMTIKLNLTWLLKWFKPSFMSSQISSKNILICVPKTTGFGTTRGWVINDRIFIFGWTIPLHRWKIKYKLKCPLL